MNLKQIVNGEEMETEGRSSGKYAKTTTNIKP